MQTRWSRSTTDNDPRTATTTPPFLSRLKAAWPRRRCGARRQAVRASDGSVHSGVMTEGPHLDRADGMSSLPWMPGGDDSPISREARGEQDPANGVPFTTLDATAYPDWDAAYLDNVGRLYRLMYRKVGNRPDAEDLTSEVFRAALGPLRLTASKGEVRAYLLATARTVLASHWRRRAGLEVTHIDPDVDLRLSRRPFSRQRRRPADPADSRHAAGPLSANPRAAFPGGLLHQGVRPRLDHQREQRQGPPVSGLAYGRSNGRGAGPMTDTRRRGLRGGDPDRSASPAVLRRPR